MRSGGVCTRGVLYRGPLVSLVGSFYSGDYGLSIQWGDSTVSRIQYIIKYLYNHQFPLSIRLEPSNASPALRLRHQHLPCQVSNTHEQFNRAAYRTPPEHISRAIRGKGGHTNSPPNTNIGHQQKDRQHKRRGPTSEPRQQPIKQIITSKIRKSVETQRVKKTRPKQPEKQGFFLSCQNNATPRHIHNQLITLEHSQILKQDNRNHFGQIPCQQLIRTAVKTARVALQLSQLT